MFGMDFLSEHIRSFLPNVPEQQCTSVNTIASKQDTLHVKHDNASYGVICFSKDRPCQLHLFLHSLQWLDVVPAFIYVIYCTSPQYEQHYEAIYKNYSVIPIRQTCFEDNVVQSITSLQEGNIDYVMMAVDDMLFYAPTPIKYD